MLMGFIADHVFSPVSTALEIRRNGRFFYSFFTWHFHTGVLILDIQTLE